MMRTMGRETLSRLGLVLGVLVYAGCQDLDVANPNAPDRDRALTQPASVESLLASSWRAVWDRAHWAATAAYPLPTLGDEMTATYSNNANLELSSEPRMPFDNTSTSASHTVARIAWLDFNEMLAAGNDVLAVIERGLVVETNDGTGLKDNTERARTFAKFMQGLGLGYLGLAFDRAYIADEHTDLENLPDYSPYPEVVAAGIEKLEEAAALAEANDFTLPNTWILGVTVSNEELARIAHSYIARFLVYAARNPAERAAVDWDAVIEHVDAGITADHGVVMSSNVSSYYLLRAQSATALPARADYRLIGPADISGRYQQWIQAPPEQRNRFDIVTPDRRITGPGGPQTDGKYFRYMPTDVGFDATRGTYHLSAYQWYRLGGRYNSGPAAIMSVDEMRLLKAEAYLRKGMLQEAADLINVTRVTNGELPPVTADGVPESADCVPRTDEGACGSLLDALHYERMIELTGLDAMRAWLDRRGFGTLTPGTFLHFPVPASELEIVGIPIYTFGGIGREGSAE